MHLNSGLLLRKPGESIYAVARRFAIANQAHNYASLIQEARQRLVNEKSLDRTNLSLIGRLACHTEMELCATLGIELPPYSLDPPAPLAHHPWSLTITRHCPQCAEGIFHSSLYELPWLTHCPMHHHALVTRCPACGDGWPELARLWSRSCPVCGVRLSQEALLQASRCATEWDFAPLEFLARMVDCKKLWDNTSLRPRHPDWEDGALDSYAHFPVRLRDPHYPSVISSLDVDIQHFCHRHRIYTGNCVCINFGNLSTPKTFSCPTKWSPESWMTRCQEQIKAKIIAAVARSAGPRHQLTTRTLWHWMWTPAAEHCVYCKAFSQWCDLIRQYPARRSSSVYEQNQPHVPQAMRLLESKAFTLLPNGQRRIEDISRYFEIPLAAQRFIYSLDLWTTFVAIFQRVEYQLTSPASFPYASMIDRREREMSVAPFISQSTAFLRTDNNDLMICVPKLVLQPQIRTRFAEHWVRVCPSRPNYSNIFTVQR